MISDLELWACANQVLNHHGPDVDAFIENRAKALASAGDEAGIKTWLAIARRVDQLRNVEGRAEPRH